MSSTPRNLHSAAGSAQPQAMEVSTEAASRGQKRKGPGDEPPSGPASGAGIRAEPDAAPSSKRRALAPLQPSPLFGPPPEASPAWLTYESPLVKSRRRLRLSGAMATGDADGRMAKRRRLPLARSKNPSQDHWLPQWARRRRLAGPGAPGAARQQAPPASAGVPEGHDADFELFFPDDAAKAPALPAPPAASGLAPVPAASGTDAAKSSAAEAGKDGGAAGSGSGAAGEKEGGGAAASSTAAAVFTFGSKDTTKSEVGEGEKPADGGKPPTAPAAPATASAADAKPFTFGGASGSAPSFVFGGGSAAGAAGTQNPPPQPGAGNAAAPGAGTAVQPAAPTFVFGAAASAPAPAFGGGASLFPQGAGAAVAGAGAGFTLGSSNGPPAGRRTVRARRKGR